MVAENNSDIAALKLSFITADDREWNDEKSKIFEISPNSPKTLYCFNMSDVQSWDESVLGFRFTVETEGVSSGVLKIDRFRFDEEEILSDSAGDILSCRTDGTDVSVEGTLNIEKIAELPNAVLQLYTMYPHETEEEVIASAPCASLPLDGKRVLSV